ncbi:hypothetical protein CspHIS471_0408690 [Cutaneotrichosporon sp. HIS471]|nr:hypothetical protein CspHIS471_0408690 [Cutaneotrichosporon sp. HIS471]
MSAISEQELEREVRTLKHLRRRSATGTGPGELPLDPDLPPPDSFQQGSEAMQYSSNDDVTLSLDGDSGLFWVPAHLHPELAPGEFRNFLKTHTVDPDADGSDTDEATLARSPSWLARSRSMSVHLNRKKSMLSKQYTPRPGDNVETERVPVRRGSLAARHTEQGPTLRDLQKLEELVDDPEFTQNPDKMREVLRRSLSQRMQPGLNETTEGDGETDAPLLPPRTGSIIRRTARTKIRKGPNDGSRRYSSGRRQRITSPSQQHIHGESSSLEDGDRRSDERRSDETSEETSEAFHEPAPVVVEHLPAHDDSTDESQIVDAYTRASVVEPYDGSRSPSPDEPAQAAVPHGRQRPHLQPIITSAEKPVFTPAQQDADLSAALHAVTLLPPSGASEDIFQARPDSFVDNYADAYAGDEAYRAYLEEEEEGPPAPSPPSEAAAVMQQQQPQVPGQQALLPGMAPPLQSMPPSMSTSGQQRPVPPTLVIDRPPLARTDSNASVQSSASSTATAASISTTPPYHHHGREKEKEKSRKGLFGKKHSKEKDKPKKEKDGLFGGLFGGSKKKQEEASSVSNFATAGPAAAAALLGTSKSARSLQPSGASSPTSPGFSNFARYPIHVERAVYRLSHIKLANARRPLIEQVLISNLMFWYLGVIGRAAGPAEDSKPGTVNGLDKDRDETQRTPPPKGTPPLSPDSGQLEDKSAHLRQQPSTLQQQPRRDEQQQELSPPPSPSPTRKTGLVKPERSRNANNSEAAYRAPQYGKQNAQMEQEMRPAQLKPTPQPQQQQQPTHRTSPPPPQREQQQPPASYPQAPAPAPRTSSIPSNPQRTRSPPSPAHQHPQVRPEYPPGVAPPRPQQFAPGGGRPISQQPERRPQPPPGAQPARPQQPGMRPPPQPQHQGAQQTANGSMRPDRPMYAPYPSGGGGGPAQRNGGQPGQGYPYPQQYARPGHHGPQPGQIFSAQPGQIFHHPQYQNQPRPPGAAPAQNRGEPQRLPPGQQQGPALAPTPPRRGSSNAPADPYGRQGYQQSGQTSPTHGGFYSQQRPPGQYQQYPPGQQRAQPVPSGQYPHHR